MNRTLIASALLAATAFTSLPSLAAGEADYFKGQFPDVVSQRTRAEVNAEASLAALHAADVDSKSRVLPAVKSAISRSEVREAAVTAGRAGLIPHGEASF
ncbi:MAG: DUF4148 domain-containing protein [Curvibacter sp.]|nr:DUF4148 domain-containing protein [Curvibacter sp.]